jgi:hypothetical protein
MAADPRNGHEVIQFRRQLVATVAGALIAMSTTTAVTVFQWVTQSKEQRHRTQVEALSQFAAEVSRLTGAQAAAWHIANRCSYVAARARRLAHLPDLTKQDAVSEYKDLLNTAWAVEAEIASEYREAAQRRAATAAAYYKLMIAFDDVPARDMSRLSKPTSDFGTAPASPVPQVQELLGMATLFENWSTGFKSEADNTATLYNDWNTYITKLGAAAKR